MTVPWFRQRLSLAAALCLAASLTGKSLPLSSAVEQPQPPVYSPVAPADAVQFALASNLKLVQNWLDEKDFTSAVQSAQGLAVLAQLYGYQSVESSWRQRIAAFRETCSRLTAAARAKDPAGCEKQAQECARILAELADRPPTSPKVVDKKFIAFGPTKTWMLLMDGAYVDAKTAKTARDMEQLAFVLAEEANVILHQRPDANWKQTALETREEALTVAALARGNDLERARIKLKDVYNRCEACHQGFKRQ
jgi:hypothetical protein